MSIGSMDPLLGLGYDRNCALRSSLGYRAESGSSASDAPTAA